MKSKWIAVFVLTASAALASGQSGESEPLRRLSDSASQQLSSAIAELGELRDRIAAEKLPLARELTSLEERLGTLREEQERTTRAVDEGHLELTAIQARLTARKDELAYAGNLLDEYAKTFESKVHPCELKRCEAELSQAKEAGENTELSMSGKFDHQVSFVRFSIGRLLDSLGGLRFAGAGVDLQGSVVDGTFAILGPVALFSGASGVAGLAVPQSESALPLIRPLEGPIQAGIASLVQSGEGLLPFDPSRGGALKALIQETNLIHIFEKGGPIMWPLLAASVLALGTVLERALFLMRERRKRDRKSLERIFASVEQGDLSGAISGGRSSRDFVVRTLSYALEHKEKSLTNALMIAQSRELKRFRRGISILDTVITLAPLLGLLGTVTGMMGSFSLIGGELSAPGAITGGIAEALIATAFGLGIAITALLPFNVLNAKLEEAQRELETAATQLELLIHPHTNSVVVMPAPRPETHVLRPALAGKE